MILFIRGYPLHLTFTYAYAYTFHYFHDYDTSNMLRYLSSFFQLSALTFQLVICFAFLPLHLALPYLTLSALAHPFFLAFAQHIPYCFFFLFFL